MISDPVILVLEDERLQLLSLRSQLSDLGRLAEFSQPDRALNFAREHRCDAAIIDIRMPRYPTDGVNFLRVLREFDQDLAVIIRTADESERVIDAAIELRASKRAIKLRTSVDELRRATLAAIHDTQVRREATFNARTAAEAKAQLAQALGEHDLRLAAADMHRGLVQQMRDELTALSALASLVQRDAINIGRDTLVQHASRSSALVAHMVDAINTFLDGPLGSVEGVSSAPVNECLRAVRYFLQTNGRWAAENKITTIRALEDNFLVACPALALTNGLRHLMEYLLLRLQTGAGATLTPEIAHVGDALDQRLAQSDIVVNRSAFRRNRPWVSFRAVGELAATNLGDLREALTLGPPDSRIGSLRILGEIVSAANGAILLAGLSANTFAVDVLIPAAL